MSVHKFPHKTSFCVWCNKRIKVPHNHDHKETEEQPFCSYQCTVTEWLFTHYFSDKAINRRRKRDASRKDKPSH